MPACPLNNAALLVNVVSTNPVRMISWHGCCTTSVGVPTELSSVLSLTIAVTDRTICSCCAVYEVDYINFADKLASTGSKKDPDAYLVPIKLEARRL